VDNAASPDRALTASPSFSVKDAAAKDAFLFSLARGRDRPCNVPEGDVSCDGLVADAGIAVVKDDRSLPTTRSSKDKEFSTARDSEVSGFSFRGSPFSFRWRFHSWRRSGDTSDLFRTYPFEGDLTTMGCCRAEGVGGVAG
jgi:hypothetical protein